MSVFGCADVANNAGSSKFIQLLLDAVWGDAYNGSQLLASGERM